MDARKNIYRNLKNVCRLMEAYLFFLISIAGAGDSARYINLTSSKAKDKDSRARIEVLRARTGTAAASGTRTTRLVKPSGTSAIEKGTAPERQDRGNALSPFLTPHFFYLLRLDDSDTDSRFTTSFGFPFPYNLHSHLSPLRI